MDILNNVNWIDVVIFAILIMSIWVGLVRGFLHELVASLHWMVAALGVYYLSSPVIKAITPTLEPYLQSLPMLSDHQKILVFRLIFVMLFFILLLLLSHIMLGMFTRPVRSKIFGSANHALGAVLGFLKGLVILAVIWFFIRHLNVEELETMKANSILIMPVNITADIIAPYIQNALFWVSEKGSNLLQEFTNVS